MRYGTIDTTNDDHNNYHQTTILFSDIVAVTIITLKRLGLSKKLCMHIHLSGGTKLICKPMSVEIVTKFNENIWEEK